MARQLIIVSRQHPDLYVYLCDRFPADGEVEVILDRRLGAHRREELPAQAELRRRNRRSRPGVDAQLRSRSHVIVTLRATPVGPQAARP